jgi:predicted transposase YdaD
MENHVRRIYLNEIEINPQQSLWLGIAKLLVETPTKTTPLAQAIITQVGQVLPDDSLRQKVIEFIQTIVVYKFPNLSREEIEAMLDVSEFKNTRFYQSILEQTKLQCVSILLEAGFSVQQIAERLEIDVEVVRKVARQ